MRLTLAGQQLGNGLGFNSQGLTQTVGCFRARGEASDRKALCLSNLL